MISWPWMKTDLDSLPEEILSQDKFLVWRYTRLFAEEKAEVNHKEVKMRKLPYTLLENGEIKIGLKSGRCVSFEKMIDLLKENKALGVRPGFFLKGAGLSVIDIDNFDPKHKNLGRILLKLLSKGCYVETSPSGEGLHIFYSGFLDWTNGRQRSSSSLKMDGAKETSCEVFLSTDIRFITLTGKRLNQKLQPLPMAEDLEEELMELKELFFPGYERKKKHSDLEISFRQNTQKAEVKISKDLSEKLQLTVAKIEDSSHRTIFSLFCKEDKPDKYPSPSEADMAFSGLLKDYLDPEWSKSDKEAILQEAFDKLRKSRGKTKNRPEYVSATVSTALNNSTTYFRDKLLKKEVQTVDRDIIFNICNIMKIFSFGKSYLGFEYINERNSDNVLKVTAQESLTPYDLRFFMQILSQHRKYFLCNRGTSTGEPFDFNVSAMLYRLKLQNSGFQYKRFHDSLLRLSKVHLDYHKLVDEETRKFHNKAGSLLSFDRIYFKGGSVKEWSQVKLQLGVPFLAILEEARFNYSIFNMDSFESFSSPKLQLLYYHLAQNTMPGKGYKVFTRKELLSLWPSADTLHPSTLRSRKKDLKIIVEKFVNEQEKIKDLRVEAIYDQNSLVKVKARKIRLKPI